MTVKQMKFEFVDPLEGETFLQWMDRIDQLSEEKFPLLNDDKKIWTEIIRMNYQMEHLNEAEDRKLFRLSTETASIKGATTPITVETPPLAKPAEHKQIQSESVPTTMVVPQEEMPPGDDSRTTPGEAWQWSQKIVGTQGNRFRAFNFDSTHMFAKESLESEKPSQVTVKLASNESSKSYIPNTQQGDNAPLLSESVRVEQTKGHVSKCRSSQTPQKKAELTGESSRSRNRKRDEQPNVTPYQKRPQRPRKVDKGKSAKSPPVKESIGVPHKHSKKRANRKDKRNRHGPRGGGTTSPQLYSDTSTIEMGPDGLEYTPAQCRPIPIRPDKNPVFTAEMVIERLTIESMEKQIAMVERGMAGMQTQHA